MKRSLLLLLVLLSVMGCQNRRRMNAQIETWGAERRWLEDQIWDAKNQLDMKDEKVRKLEEENKKLKQRLEGIPPFEPSLVPSSSKTSQSTQTLPELQIDIGMPSNGVPVPPEPGPLPAGDPPVEKVPPEKSPEGGASGKDPSTITRSKPAEPTWTPRKGERVAKQPGDSTEWSPNR